mmetsp:Transcript_51167/g.61639  ORF Transcript_51167/g.61639 Transcript_51167/m.61639 type:complete len:93 (+) Transcript_51167:218-496(+)
MTTTLLLLSTTLLLYLPIATSGIRALQQLDEPSFKRPDNLKGYNPNRFIVKGDAEDVKRIAELEGGTIRGHINHGQASVIEFESHEIAKIFS